MRVAFISDVHGNDIALETCVDTLRRLNVDRVHFLGDAVGYLPDEAAVLQRLRKERIICQQGNHEAMLMGERAPDDAREALYRLAPVRARLLGTPEWHQACGWPRRMQVEYGGRRFLLVHGSPADELFGYVHQDTELEPFADVCADVVVMANTHRPWIRQSGGRVFVNTGSVGLPRDHGGLAAFALYEARTGSFRILRVRLDVDRIRAAYGPDTAPEVLACFARRADQPVGEILP